MTRPVTPWSAGPMSAEGNQAEGTQAEDEDVDGGQIDGQSVDGTQAEVRQVESVWDYPRPPALRHVQQHVVVRLAGQLVADCTEAIQILETSHPPTYYLPRSAFVPGALRPVDGASWCEFKGAARYLDVCAGETVRPAAAWFYPAPSQGYDDLVYHVALYPGRMQQCTVDGEVVQAQEGDFYGGWITSRVSGPFKGAPGTRGW